MKIESKTRKAVLGFTTFLLLLTAFALYFFFFVDQRREDLSRKNFSILSQASENIAAKMSTYDQNIDNVKQLLEKGHEINAVLVRPDQSKSSKATNLQIFSWLKSQGAINANLTAEEPTGQAHNYSQVFLEENAIVKEIVVNKSALSIKQDLASFMSPLLWQEDFDDYIILNDSSKIIYQKGNLGIYSIKLDSLLQKEGGNHSLKAGTEKTTQIQGSNYKLFAYPFRISSEQKFVLVGLRSAEAFNEQSMRISSLTIVFAATLFFMLLLSFPFLKIFLISKTERLYRTDILICLASLFATTSLVGLLMLDMFQYRKYSEQHIQKNLKAVSGSVETHFKQEMAMALKQLRIYDTLYAQGCYKGNKTNLNQPTPDSCFLTPLSPIDYRFKPTTYKNFDIVFWINDKGMQTNKWTVKSQNTSAINVNKREYFQKIYTEKGWRWPKQGIDLFYLESIYSLTTGKSYAALSIPSADSKSEVVGMTAELRSIFDPILTHGYRYALIDKKGTVLFHSDKRRNLQENILHDISNPNEVTSAINSRVFSSFSTTYHGDDFEACITPVEDWPIYIVTLYDTTYFKSANAEILSVCIVMLALYGVLIFILLLIVHFGSYAPTKLHFSKTRLNWIVPHPQNARLYQQSVVYNLLLGTFFILCYFLIGYDYNAAYSQLILLALLCALYSIPGTFFILSKKVPFRIFLSRQFPVLLFSAVCVVFINISAFLSGVPLYHLLLFQGLSILTFAFLRVVLHRWVIRLFKYPTDYKVAILTFTLIICLPPVFAFFKVSHDTEFRLYTKLVQLDFANNLAASNRLEDCIASCKEDNLPVYAHLSPILEIPPKPAGDEAISRDSLFTTIYTNLRVLFSDKISETQHLNQSKVIGENWAWNDAKHNVVLNYSGKPNTDKLRVGSVLSDYNLELEKPLNTLIILVISSMIISLLYLLISFIFRKTVMSKLLQQRRPVLMDMDVFGSALSSKKSDPERLKDQNIFLIGLPNAGKTQFIHDRLLSRDAAYHKLDFTTLRDKTVEELWNTPAKAASTIIFDHFEFGLHDIEVIKKKLVLLENIASQGNIRMIAVSTIHPLEMIDSSTLQKISGVDPIEANILSERWIRIFGNFYKSFFTIAFNTNIYREELDDEDPLRLIENECRHGGFLKSIEGGLKTYASVNPVSNDELILKIQSLATFYYYALWKSCTAEEKYLLYDLAQDGLINTRNVNVITSLLNKGLVHSMGTLVLLNRSFRNFILTTVKPEEALQLEDAIKQTGTWSIIRIPLIVTLLTLGVFIFYTQRDILNNALALMATLAAALPMVLKVISSFKSGEKGAG